MVLSLVRGESMNKPVTTFIFTITMLFILTGCTSVSEEPIKKAIEDNVQYAEDENLDGYMQSLFLTEEQKEFTREQTLLLFKNTELSYQINSIKILKETKTTAKVEVMQTTIAKEVKDGFDFADNETLSHHTMKLFDGQWKITDTDIQRAKYFE